MEKIKVTKEQLQQIMDKMLEYASTGITCLLMDVEEGTLDRLKDEMRNFFEVTDD